jgi:NAD(P)-dependent dehydrogenase (short-subunit alcohol dehydrogenase family)
MTLLRDGLLGGRAVALAGGVPAPVGDALGRAGARLEALPEFVPAEEGVGEWARARSPLDALVYCASDAFGPGGRAGLDAALAQAWAAIREIVTGDLIPRGQAGKVLLIAPPPDAGSFARAAQAALENLARTLSVEWARYGLTVTMIAPGGATTDAELAEIVCYLVSEAGDYFSGCRFDLGLASPVVGS